MTKRMPNLLKAAVLALGLAQLAACLPNNNIAKTAKSTSTTSGLSGLGSDSAASDGALAPCNQYDPSAPTRAVCVSCYQSILATRCPGKAEFASCLDPAVRSGYVPLVNQCISQTVQAGFVCTTTCTGGQVLNPSTCTCVAPTVSAGSGTSTIDVGQTNFGPPIVQAQFPQAIQGSPSPLPMPYDDQAGCGGTFDLYLGVQNRGDTVFKLNDYGTPIPGPSSSPNPMGTRYIASASKPVMLTTSEVASHPGSNVKTQIEFVTGGGREITGDPVDSPTFTPPKSSRASVITTVSGLYSDGANAGSDGPGTAATWLSPNFGARDRDGNLYFTDALSHTVRVICYKSTTTGNCNGVTNLGDIKTIGGTAGSAGHSPTLFNSPHGIAVDYDRNVYVADSGNHVIRMIDSAGTVSDTLCGTAGTAGPISGNLLNYPYGIDIYNGTVDYLVIADYQNHAIRRCDLSTGTMQTLVGDGTPGYRANGGDAVAGTRLHYPTDVKQNWYGNMVIADSRNHLIRALCIDGTRNDFCSGITVPGGSTRYLKTIAGKAPTGSNGSTTYPGSSGDGGAAIGAQITLPYSLTLAKRYSNDYDNTTSGFFPHFRDNNVLFTEKFLAGNRLAGVATPVQVGNQAGLVSMHMGLNHSCFLSNTGAVTCIGDNTSKQMGNPNASTPQTAPTSVPSVSIPGGKIRGGSRHTCAINSSGSAVQCWGLNNDGQLGGAGILTPDTPIPTIPGPSGPNWTSMAGGDRHTCGFDDAGNDLWCWGDGSLGQLGSGSYALTSPAVQVDITGAVKPPDMTGSVTVSAGANHACMAYEDDMNPGDYYVSCWGDNSAGQLGNTGTANFPRPVVEVQNLPIDDPITSYAGGNHNCALTDDEVWCWGSNQYGELGRGNTTPYETSAAQVTLPLPVQQLALGLSHTCARMTGGKVQCWGDNSSGQLGNDDVPMSTIPIDVIGLPAGSVYYIYASGNQSCALVGSSSTNLTPYCWGNNSFKQLGTGASGIAPHGNTLRIVCGDNSDAETTNTFSTGYCDRMAPGTINTISGKDGDPGSRSTGDGQAARKAKFAKIAGVTYDFYKNIIVSSTGFIDNTGTAFSDYNLRLILNQVNGTSVGYKYSATDSNALTSFWCLKIRPQTACDPFGNCACAMGQPVDDPIPEFWSASSLNGACP